MSLIAISSLESQRRKFFMTSTYIMSELDESCLEESNVFGLKRRKKF